MEAIDMQGKVCLVTGCTSGMGKVTARELAKMGATLVMVCRNRTKGEAVQAEIKRISDNAQVELIVADLSQLVEVRRVASEFKQKYTQLHVLINNAGTCSSEYLSTIDGLENAFATNYLSPFLLTQLLLETLKASAPARIINVSSSAHRNMNFDFADPQRIQKEKGLRAYSQSKLAQVYFTYELADRLAGTGVTVNTLNPGLVRTNIYAGMKGFFYSLLFLMAISVEKGAQTQIFLATSPAVEGVNGKYFSNSKEKRSSKHSYDVAIRRRLWELSEALIQQHETVAHPLV